MTDLTIPDFLKVENRRPLTAVEEENVKAFFAAKVEASDDWPYDVRPDNCSAADIAVMAELSGRREVANAVKEYEAGKYFAEMDQWRIENPDLAKMDAKARRDAKRRVAKLGIKATGRTYKRRAK